MAAPVPGKRNSCVLSSVGRRRNVWEANGVFYTGASAPDHMRVPVANANQHEFFLMRLWNMRALLKTRGSDAFSGAIGRRTRIVAHPFVQQFGQPLEIFAQE